MPGIVVVVGRVVVVVVVVVVVEVVVVDVVVVDVVVVDVVVVVLDGLPCAPPGAAPDVCAVTATNSPTRASTATSQAALRGMRTSSPFA